jgi:hypothetical protein
MDILKTIYDVLISDQEIADQASGKIKFYEFPDSMAIEDGPYIIIEPLDVPIPIIFGDNERLIYDGLFQVESWSKTRDTTREIAERIESLLWRAGFSQVGGLNEYDSGVFRDARRYRKRTYSDAWIQRELDAKDDLVIFIGAESVIIGGMNKTLSLTAIVNEKTKVFLSGSVGEYLHFIGEINSDSFTNASLKRSRFANFITVSQSKIDGTLETISLIDLIVSSLTPTDSQAAIGLRKSYSADVLALTSNAAAMSIRSFFNLGVGITSQTNQSAAISVESVFPGTPTIEATELFNAIRIDWEPTTKTDSYKLYRTTNPDNLGPMIIEITDGTTTYTDTTAVAGTIYYYKLKSVNIRGAKNSNQVAATASSIQTFENHLVDFEGYPNYTIYDTAAATNDFGNVDTLQGGDRLKTDTSGRLRFYLPTGMLGSANTGGIIKAKIVPKNEYTFEYEIRFDAGFPWSMGGKVPGFSGGAGYTGGSGDGARTGDGFSVRMMWREDGRIIPYLYYYEMPGDFGHTFGETLGYFTNTKAHKVKYWAKLNTGSDKNGALKIWLDDVEVLNKTDLIYRTDNSKIDTVHISIFAGGSTPEWNMTGDGYIRLSYISWT